MTQARRRQLGFAFATSLLVLGLLALVSENRHAGAPLAQAGVPATPTPPYDCDVDPDKPCPDGNLSGVYDVTAFTDADPDSPTYHCIARHDHEASTNDIKVAAVCSTELDSFGDPNAVHVDVPGEGADGSPGPPAPPPYTLLPVAKGAGAYLPAGGTYDPPGGNNNAYNCPTANACVVTLTCFARLGASILGENVLAVVVVDDPKTQLAANGKLAGFLVLESGHNNADCRAFNGNGHAGSYGSSNLTIYPADDSSSLCALGCETVPWRDASQRGSDGRVDWDGDGCSDFMELDKTGQFTCGDDPWNPYDSNSSDYSGSYAMLVEVVEAGAVPGAYFHCIADVQQTGDGKADGQIRARLFCYTDVPAFEINPEAFPGETGDGFPGAAPPGPEIAASGTYVFGDVNGKHTELVGMVKNTTHTLELRGCFEDLDAAGPLGNVYIEAGIDAHRGEGTIDIWLLQSSDNCTTGAAFGQYIDVYAQPPYSENALIFVARQPPGPKANGARDSDGDGCPDKDELSDDPSRGGLRDPYNPYDYYDVGGGGGDPTPDGVIDLPNDILGVILHFAPSGGGPYDARYDRAPDTGTGAGNWNRYGTDGVIDLPNDILGVILQYNPGGC